jgi:hypothetical protein
MKTASRASLIAIVVFLAATTVASAAPWQGWRGSGGWGMGTPYQSLYDPTKVETLSGEVLGLEKVVPMRGMNYAIQMKLKTDKETLTIQLGPDWYIERLDVKIIPGDKVVVTGSRVTFNGKPVVIAAELKKGDTLIVLRDAQGVPVWAGPGWQRR